MKIIYTLKLKHEQTILTFLSLLYLANISWALSSPPSVNSMMILLQLALETLYCEKYTYM